MYTTSRYASRETREFASSLAKKESSIYLARGKKTISQIAEYARKKGEEQIFVIEEKNDRPLRMALIRVLETGAWEWAGEKLLTA